MYNVMIVEDEKIIRNGIKNLIERFGGELSVKWELANAFDAWEQFQAEAPDLVITDIVMRGITGLELAGKIRESGSSVPVIILSGYSEFSYAQEAIRCGVFEYVLKPINVKQFVEVLDKARCELDRRRDGHELPENEDVQAQHKAIRLAEDYVKNNLGGDLSLPTVAARVNMSANYLSMLFKSVTNTKYSDYVTHLRIEKAKQLLRQSDFKIYEIAEICGFNSVKHFISVFKKVAGTTPKQYKNTCA